MTRLSHVLVAVSTRQLSATKLNARRLLHRRNAGNPSLDQSQPQNMRSAPARENLVLVPFRD